jgi:hypothetical protein
VHRPSARACLAADYDETKLPLSFLFLAFREVNLTKARLY